MSRLVSFLNALIGLAVVAGALMMIRSSVLGPPQQFSPPNDAWFRSEVLDSKQPVVVKFGAPWCPPCEALNPELDQLGHSDQIAVVRIDVDKNPALARHYHISAIPHLFLFRDGSIVADRVGYANVDDLRKWVAEHTKRVRHGALAKEL